MRDIQISEIELQRKKVHFGGLGAYVETLSAPDPVVRFHLRGELMEANGTAHLLEDARDALLSLITRIEERCFKRSVGVSFRLRSPVVTHREGLPFPHITGAL